MLESRNNFVLLCFVSFNGLAVFVFKHALALAHASGGGKCRRRIPFPKGGRTLPGLHKRSTEDKGGSCARQGRSPLGRHGFGIAGRARNWVWGVAGCPRWDGESPRHGRSSGVGWELGKGADLPGNAPELLAS